MEERLQFVRDALSDRFTMSELCARYGISRRIGYKWLARYEAEWRLGLRDHSRAPHECPHRFPKAMEALLLKERQAHPFWGARKLLKVVETRYPKIERWPSASTAADLHARHGLVQKRRRRRPSTHPGAIRPPQPH
jgi:putative transposase